MHLTYSRSLSSFASRDLREEAERMSAKEAMFLQLGLFLQSPEFISPFTNLSTTNALFLSLKVLGNYEKHRIQKKGSVT